MVILFGKSDLQQKKPAAAGAHGAVILGTPKNNFIPIQMLEKSRIVVLLKK